MKTNRHFNIVEIVGSDFNKRPIFHRTYIGFVFILLFSSLSAQTESGNVTPVIAVEEGTKIHSVDQDFNLQIANGKVILKNSDIAINKIDSSHVVLIASGKKEISQLNEAPDHLVILKDKKPDTLKKAEHKTKVVESEEKLLEDKILREIPSSEQFAALSHINKDYIVPSAHGRHFSDFLTLSDILFIRKALDFLHSQKYTFYNSRSKDFCFSKIFSVRPPPSGSVFSKNT